MSESKERKVTIGRTVIYIDGTGIEMAAIVTRVTGVDRVNLCVFLPDGGTTGRVDIPKGENAECWKWPTLV